MAQDHTWNDSEPPWRRSSKNNSPNGALVSWNRQSIFLMNHFHWTIIDCLFLLMLLVKVSLFFCSLRQVPGYYHRLRISYSWSFVCWHHLPWSDDWSGWNLGCSWESLPSRKGSLRQQFYAFLPHHPSDSSCQRWTGTSVSLISLIWFKEVVSKAKRIISILQFEVETVDGIKYFGPAFRNEFVREALHLQLRIQEVSVILPITPLRPLLKGLFSLFLLLYSWKQRMNMETLLVWTISASNPWHLISTSVPFKVCWAGSTDRKRCWTI